MKLDVATHVVAATVFPDRAQVTRTGVVDLARGVSRLQVSKLPQGIAPESVRASGRAGASTRLLGVEVRREHYVETPADRVRELQREVERLQDEIQEMGARKALVQRQQEALNDLMAQPEVYARGLAYGRTTIADQLAAFGALRSHADEHRAEFLDLEARERSVRHELTKYQQELAELGSAAQRERYRALLDVDADQACEFTLELMYVVGHAGWTPLYDVRLTEAGGEEPVLELAYLAEVTQRTGEDWTDTEITLSTARPTLAETVPELEPWYVGLVRDRCTRPVSLGRSTPMASLSCPPLSPTVMAPGEPMYQPAEAAEEAEPVVTTVEWRGTTVTYRVPGRMTIAADGAAHKATVARLELAPQIDHLAAPKLVEAAYRRTTVVNDSDYVLLPGAVYLFVGDTFVGTTEIDLIAPEGEMELLLGPDDRLRVKRELTRREVDKKLIGGRRRVTTSYEILLENLLEEELRLTLRDQVPVAEHEQIKVRLASAEPEVTEESELGILTWELTLAPSERRRVSFEFAVEHPRDTEVFGL